MKRALLYIFLAAVGLTSCQKDDDNVFDQSPDERLNKALTEYQSQLAGAENGWKAVIYPVAGGAYSFYFKFNNDNRVQMFSDFDSTSAVTRMESSYRLKALQQPALIFDTYSYVHLLADPNGLVNGGSFGQGLQSDFEFAFDGVSGDSIKLTGRFHGSRAVLVKATKQEADAFNNKQLGNGLAFQNINRLLNYFKQFTLGNRSYEISVNQVTRTVTLSWVSGNGSVQSFTTQYYYTVNGIEFVNPLSDGVNTIRGFSGISYDAANSVLRVTVNNSQIVITGATKPLKVDLQAPRRWWQQSVNQGSYWVSPTGFTINGVEDALNLQGIPGYNYLLFWANVATIGTNGVDAAVAVFASGSEVYGPALLPSFTNDGRINFAFAGGNFGTSPSAGATTIMANTQNQFTESSGYYLVQTGENSYDMVSAKDAKAWVSWIWVW